MQRTEASQEESSAAGTVVGSNGSGNCSQAHTKDVRQGAGAMRSLGLSRITARSIEIAENSDEKMLWEERPSLLVILIPLLKYGLLWLAFTMIANAFQASLDDTNRSRSETVAKQNQLNEALKSSQLSKAERISLHRQVSLQAKTLTSTNERVDAFKLKVDFFETISQLAGWLAIIFLSVKTVRLCTTTYRASNQRLFIESGVRSSKSVTWEMTELDAGVVDRPLLLRPFNISSLEFCHGEIKLIGLRNSDFIRDIVRRSGQIERAKSGAPDSHST